MNLLAIDTSTERLCVALCQDGGHGAMRIHAHEETGGANASQRLLPAAQALLATHGLTWHDLNGLAFGQGPGAFTGLRGACAAVQGLALGLDLQVVAIPSLRIVAEAARRQLVLAGALRPDQPCMVRVAMDARMGQLYDGAGIWDGRHWQGIAGPAVREPAEVAADWLAQGVASPTALHRQDLAHGQMPLLVAGSGLQLLPTTMAADLRACVQHWVDEESDRAGALGHCAIGAWTQGQARLDAAQVMPLYVRDRVAQTTAERLALQAGEAARARAASATEPVITR